MSEEDISTHLFVSASTDPSVEVLTWHAVDGKSYFTPSVKLRLLSGERMEPDLVVQVTEPRVWLIEVKETHQAAMEDEKKLVLVYRELGRAELIRQIARRVERDIDASAGIELAVAFDGRYEAQEGCQPGVRHLCWSMFSTAVEDHGFAVALSLLP